MCGACCAYYRISFDSNEVDDNPGGIIPLQLTVKLAGSRSAMMGTEKKPVRCQALIGQITLSVCCSIYDKRPSTCRNFLSIWEHNVINALCDRARAAYGLMPLSYY
jgi:Fe-S-cluster containining protein